MVAPASCPLRREPTASRRPSPAPMPCLTRRHPLTRHGTAAADACRARRTDKQHQRRGPRGRPSSRRSAARSPAAGGRNRSVSTALQTWRRREAGRPRRQIGARQPGADAEVQIRVAIRPVGGGARLARPRAARRGRRSAASARTACSNNRLSAASRIAFRGEAVQVDDVEARRQADERRRRCGRAAVSFEQRVLNVDEDAANRHARPRR